MAVEGLREELTCSLSQDYFVDPVRTSSGSVYSRAEIERWIATRTQEGRPITDPNTNTALGNNPKLTPDFKLKNIVALVRDLDRRLDALLNAPRPGAPANSSRSKAAMARLIKRRKSTEEAVRTAANEAFAPRTVGRKHPFLLGLRCLVLDAVALLETLCFHTNYRPLRGPLYGSLHRVISGLPPGASVLSGLFAVILWSRLVATFLNKAVLLAFAGIITLAGSDPSEVSRHPKTRITTTGWLWGFIVLSEGLATHSRIMRERSGYFAASVFRKLYQTVVGGDVRAADISLRRVLLGPTPKTPAAVAK